LSRGRKWNSRNSACKKVDFTNNWVSVMCRDWSLIRSGHETGAVHKRGAGHLTRTGHVTRIGHETRARHMARTDHVGVRWVFCVLLAQWLAPARWAWPVSQLIADLSYLTGPIAAIRRPLFLQGMHPDIMQGFMREIVVETPLKNLFKKPVYLNSVIQLVQILL
jgi:hypothetical protein